MGKTGAYCFFENGAGKPILVVLADSRKEVFKKAAQIFGGRLITFDKPPFFTVEGKKPEIVYRAIKARRLVK